MIGLLLVAAITIWFFVGLLIGAYLATGVWPLAALALLLAGEVFLRAVREAGA